MRCAILFCICICIDRKKFQLGRSRVRLFFIWKIIWMDPDQYINDINRSEDPDPYKNYVDGSETLL